MTNRTPASTLSDDQINAELKELEQRWHAFRQALDEEGGMAGSPGEWMVERMGELETELKRRKIGKVKG